MKKILLFVLTLATCLLFTGCKTKKNKTIKYVGLKVYDPVYIAKEKGFFKEEGVELELVDTVAGGATAVQMVASGDVQGCLLSTMALINAVDAKMPVIGVADIQSSFNDAPLEEFFVRKDSGIKEVKDLKGKKIAINLVKSSFHYTWLMALEKAGLTENDVDFVNISFGEQQEALKSGLVDAIGLMSPYIKRAKNDDTIEKLYDACDVFGERQFCEILLNTEWCKKNEKEATKFVSALRKAENWAMQNQEEAKAIISKYTGIEKENIEDYHFQENAKCVIDDAKYWLAYMKDNKFIDNELKVEDIVTNKYNTEVK